MTSQLNVDTIVDKAGSGGTNVKVAGTSTYVDGSATQNLVSASIKAFLHFDGSDNSIGDSLNIGTVTDNGTGNYVYNYTNNFDSDEYCFAGMCNDIQYGGNVHREIDGSSSSGLEVRHRHNNGSTPSQADPADTGAMMAGDLA
jgi:hypothetical protein